MAPASVVAPSTDPEATSPEPSDQGTALRPAAVREAFARLGIGTIAVPSVADTTPTVAAAPAQACTPVGTVSMVSSQTTSSLPGRIIVHPRRGDDEPPHLRGPPAPLDPSAPSFATTGSGGAAPGGASTERDCAILTDQIALTLADGGTALVDGSCDHLAPAPANAAARAPPVA